MNPNTCLSSNLIATNSPKCLPFYTGSKCELNTNAYQVNKKLLRILIDKMEHFKIGHIIKLSNV